MKKLLKNKVILITGGTGFLGRSLVREILKYNPASIRIFSRDEVKHHELQQELKVHKSKLRFLVGDVRDYERLEKATKGCDILIHAAALKRIDMIEYNVEEAIKTNILGTVNVVRASLANNIDKAIFVSTDKACSPINTYGACKFVSERIFTESNFSKGFTKTSFSCVRYGNVINSTGSVIPFFTEKIKRGEVIPLTDPEMTRFLITPRQAVDLIFKALEYGEGGEVFIPKIPAFKIIDLVNYLKGKYNSNSKIKVIGIRPGEKIDELMVNSTEVPRTYEFNNELGRGFVITSQIQKYKKKKYYQYLKKEKKVNFQEYNSKDEILQGEQLERYFNKITHLIPEL
jgi:UDP-N-acetylglucosamine 4,6-dehydratase/5-epimerase